MQQQSAKNALVIGMGGIGQAIAQELLASKGFQTVYGVSRRDLPDSHWLGVDNRQAVHAYQHITIDHHKECSIAKTCEALPQAEFSLIICALGVLHDSDSGLFPEKKLDDITPENLSQYFHENVTVPAIWLKHLVALLPKKQASKVVFLSARVGSINDNRLGGWYGYRASKSALNMLVKTAQIEIARRYKQCALVLYHPGTIDTRLSVPFQANVPDGKLFTAEFTAKQLTKRLKVLSEQGAPHYIDWSGQSVPW